MNIALELWMSILAQTPSPDSSMELMELTSLVEYLFPIFETASENLLRAFDITEEYIYLIPFQMLTNASSSFPQTKFVHNECFVSGRP